MDKPEQSMSAKEQMDAAMKQYARDDTLRKTIASIDSYFGDKESEKSKAKKQSNALTRQFKNAEQARSDVYQAMIALAEHIGVIDAKNSVKIAPMKDKNRAAEKMKDPTRDLHDLGRGRMYIRSPEAVLTFYKFLEKLDKNGYSTALKKKNVKILKNSIANFLEKSSSNGFSGTINIDVEANHGSNRKGTVEIQMMPLDFEVTYEHSHHLYEVIRLMKDSVNKNFRTEEYNEILDALIKANRALCDEAACRNGFIKLRNEKVQTLSAKKYKNTYGMLDKIQLEIDALHGRKLPWREKTHTAITFAKTSLTNLHMGIVRPQMYKNLEIG